MNTSRLASRAGVLALATIVGGCATWNDMDRQEKGTAVGATGGAVVGALVGGPVGAAVGAGVGGYVGHHQADDRYASAGAYDSRAMTGSPVVRAAQDSLNRRGFDAGPVDGQFGPSTAAAVRSFQRANGLVETGDLDPATLSALGVR